MDAKNKREPMMKFDREKTLVIYRAPSERVKREIIEELQSLAAQDYRVTKLVRTGGNVEVHMMKTDEWSVAELMDEAETLMGKPAYLAVGGR